VRSIRLMAGRTFRRLFRSPAALSGAAACVALVGGLFADALFSTEGRSASVAALWAFSVLEILPVLAACSVASAWSSVRPGGTDALLVVPVRSRAAVYGVFAGSLSFVVTAIAVAWVIPHIALRFASPAAAARFTPLACAPAFAGLLLQAAAAVAVGLFVASVCRRGLATAVVTLLVLFVLPLGIARAVVYWSPALRASFAFFPSEGHLADFASGVFPLSDAAFYFGIALWALFSCSKTVASYRFVGTGAFRVRCGTAALSLTALLTVCLVLACLMRFGASVDFGADSSAAVTARTRSIVADAAGDVRITCFVARRDPSFRRAAAVLRSLERSARTSPALRLAVDYTDPRWDFGAAARLARAGVPEGSVVFEREGRRITVPADTADESVCATALQRLFLPVGRQTVYWTTGHGEAAFDAYGSDWGMSVFARALRRAGYRLEALPAGDMAVPPDCAALVVASPRTSFPRAELARTADYLRHGGRMLLFCGAGAEVGPFPALRPFGLTLADSVSKPLRTVSGTDVPVAVSADHPVVRPLVGCDLVFTAVSPGLRFEADAVSGADRVSFTPLVLPAASDGAVYAAALERGGAARDDVAIRPMRVVVVSDPAFALDGALETRTGANVDFLLNAVSWLAGVDAFTASSVSSDAIVLPLDRAVRVRFALVSGFCSAFAFLLLGGLIARGRRP